MASESAPYNSMKGKMAAESASCGRLKGRTEAESASCSKMLRKSMDLAAKRRLGKGWSGLAGVGPAEGAMAAYFASRKQIRFCRIWISASVFSHGLARQGAGRIQSATRIPPGQTPTCIFAKALLFSRFQATWSCPSS